MNTPNWNHHSSTGDRTKTSDMIQRVIYKACSDRARQGYDNEFKF